METNKIKEKRESRNILTCIQEISFDKGAKVLTLKRIIFYTNFSESCKNEP